MKKVMIIFMTIFMMIVMYQVSYRASKVYFKDDGNTYHLSEVPSVVVDNNMEDIISNVTQFIVQKYDIDNNSLTEEIIDTPIAYIGFTREELISAIRESTVNPTTTDKTAGLTAYELVTFSKNQVIVRKSYSVANLPSIYYIYVENGLLTIYLQDKKTLYDYTTIKLSALPQEVQLEIINGKKIESQRALYEFLETYTS